MTTPVYKKILVTGARGRLGSMLCNLLNCDGIDRDELDITDSAAVKKHFTTLQFDVLIHCAAYTDVDGAEKNKKDCYGINVIGTENLIKNFTGQKFAYISTDYVFDGEQGNYTEGDTPNPVNYYALTKLLGEMIVRQHPNTLIIRTSFKADGPWPYPNAFTDLWTSAEYLSVQAPRIARAATLTGLFGTIHVAGSRKTIYDLAREQTPKVGRMSRADVTGVSLPKDVSLDSSRWNNLFKTN